MASRTLLRQIRHAPPRLYLQPFSVRTFAVGPPPNSEKPPLKQVEIPVPLRKPRQESWLTRYIRSSPTAKYWFMKGIGLLGYGGPKQLAGRQTMVIYERICAGSPEIDKDFWYNSCDLPPTFQSWFTVTNLHVWLLTVRFRALPQPHGKHYVQFILDHFFLDIEDRVRAVLQPPRWGAPRDPYTFISNFYVNPNAPATTPDGKRIQRGAAPERMVTRQLRIFREQWQGMGRSFDLALVQGDMDMAAAIWRNFLGARGARGIAFPGDENVPRYRRSVNLIGSEVEKLEKMNLEEEEARDDGSGVHDYPPEEADKYLKYPEVMLDLVTYIRRELVRLESISDEAILSSDLTETLELLKFPKVRGDQK